MPALRRLDVSIGAHGRAPLQQQRSNHEGCRYIPQHNAVGTKNRPMSVDASTDGA